MELTGAKEEIKISREKGTLGIISKNGQLLLGKRSVRPYKGLWSVFGGKVEKGETPEKALKRELFEELGIKIFKPKLVEVVVDELDWELWFYKVEQWEGEPTNLEENSEIRWFTYNEMDEISMVDITRTVITSHLDELKVTT